MERTAPPTHVVILGSTGSIGRSALSVIEHDGGARLRAWGLSGHTRWEELAAQAVAHRPRFVAVTEPDLVRRMEQELRGTGVRGARRAWMGWCGWSSTPRRTGS